MSPYAKAALFLIRLVACGLIILGLLLCGADFYSPYLRRPVSRPIMLALKAVPALAGAVLYARSKGIAVYMTKDLE